MINSTEATTDAAGEVTTSLYTTYTYAISSGLDAISFVPLSDTGTNFSARSPVRIDAERLIDAQSPPCRVYISGASNIYFSAMNKTDRALTVPLTRDQLNAIWSVTGQAIPGETFAPGQSGFAVPDSHFASADTLSGVWKFLGQEVIVNGMPDICTSTALPGACDFMDVTTLSLPREHTRKLVISLVDQALAMARTGKWKNPSGTYAVPFMKKGAQALAMMAKILPIPRGQYFKCDVAPLSCVRKTVPKAALRKAVTTLFSGTPPKGLEPVYQKEKSEMKKFDKVLSKLPNSYVWCDK